MLSSEPGDTLTATLSDESGGLKWGSVRAVANGARMTIHVDVMYGSNVHHLIEAAFKAFARALRVAISIDPDEKGVPSTKGTLSS